MNCEKCQEWISDLLDGTLSTHDELALNSHLEECLGCQEVRADLQAIVSFCETQRGQYLAPPNEQALWLRIRNMIEAAEPVAAVAAASSTKLSWREWLSRSWELSLPQLVASAAAIVLVVSLSTAVGMRRWQSVDPAVVQSNVRTNLQDAAASVLERTRQQQQMIDYWNQRVELNRARWSPQMRETFDRNLKVIDQAVNDSLGELRKNPHDEISEEMLNAALNEKLAILREFADL
jgi:anti-sigma factor RsiW